MPRILATWKRKGIKPKFHLSEPRKGAVTIMERRAHADRCQRLPDPLPEECGAFPSHISCFPLFPSLLGRFLKLTISSPADLMIEAKDKEQAVFHLFRIYGLQPTIHGALHSLFYSLSHLFSIVLTLSP
jgi:UV DNA damage endonuclease